MVQDLWQVNYQSLLIISQKEFTILNVEILIVFLNMKVTKKCKCLCCNKDHSNKLDEKF